MQFLLEYENDLESFEKMFDLSLALLSFLHRFLYNNHWGELYLLLVLVCGRCAVMN
jgi:hypothetical protein